MSAVYYYYFSWSVSVCPDSFELQWTHSELHREPVLAGADSEAAEIRFQHRKWHGWGKFLSLIFRSKCNIIGGLAGAAVVLG